MNTFEALGVSPELARALNAKGITEPFAIQKITIPDSLEGRDVCGKARTGSGKTLAFGVALLERTAKAKPCAPTALVLVPTRELAGQVCEVLEPLGKPLSVRVLACYGGAGMEAQINALARGVEIVVATPGRLIDLMERGAVKLNEVGMLVLDEADRMADMGFMPQVQRILHRITKDHQTLLFSATLDGAVDHLVKRHMTDPVFHQIVGEDPTVDEMDHRFLSVHQMDKVKVAASISRGVERTLIFVRTKRGADRVAMQLEREGIRAGAIHGDLRQSARERALADFAAGKLPVLVATDVAARGIHVDGIDVVIHYDPPEDHKAYVHRSGRTARAGESGVVVTLVLWDQVTHVEWLQRRVNVRQAIIEVFSNDPRLADLRSIDPAAGALVDA